jgi:UrcA family protein
MTRVIGQIGGAVAGAIVLSLIAASPAAADTQVDQKPRATVHYGNLDLSTVQGQARLRVKAERAALEVCQYDGALNDLDHLALQRNCLKQALASAEVQTASAIRAAEAHPALALHDQTVRY